MTIQQANDLALALESLIYVTVEKIGGGRRDDVIAKLTQALAAASNKKK